MDSLSPVGDTAKAHRPMLGLWDNSSLLGNGSSQSAGDNINMDIIEAIFFILGTSLCTLLTIVGNIMVILSVFTYRPLRCVQNFFIISLAVADILVAVCVMPFNVANYVIGHWIFGAVICNMWLTFDILMCTASILNLCAIALDRYYAIHDPINYAQKRTLKRVLVSISLIWLLSAVISIPPLLGWNNSSGRNLYNQQTMQCQLTDEKSFVVYSASGSFFIPLVIMSFVYVKIFLATRHRLRKRARAAAMAQLKRPVDTNVNSQYGSRLTAKRVSEQSSDANIGEATSELIKDAKSGQNDPLLQSSSLSPNALTHNGSTKSNMSCQSNCSFKGKHSSDESNGSKSSKAPSPRRAMAFSENKASIQVATFMEEKQRISLSKERRAARTMSIIMGVFVLCWLPFFLMYIIFPFCKDCAKDVHSGVINFIIWMGYINSALNPIIYTVFNLDFRRAFKRILQGKCNYRR